MVLFILKMNKEYAKEICSWKYTSPYTVYNIQSSEEGISELLSGSYYAAVDENNELVGFYCFGECARVPSGKDSGVYKDEAIVDIGIGLRPDLCGKGNGLEFLRKCTVLGENLYLCKNFRITVSKFNKRAIAVYKKFGFREQTAFRSTAKDTDDAFIVMTYTIE
jgi:ribosomal-protein-alanine N-acetyltransferase